MFLLKNAGSLRKNGQTPTSENTQTPGRKILLTRESPNFASAYAKTPATERSAALRDTIQCL
jgi:hypothetical protein